MTTVIDTDVVADEILEEILKLTGGDPQLLREAEQVILRTAYLRSGESDAQN